MNRDKKAMAAKIDHTCLRTDAAEADIRALCGEALEYGFASVCINPIYVPLCADLLRDTPVKVCTVIGFPLGAASPLVKAFEAERAVFEGAEELDMVISVGNIRDGFFEAARRDIYGVVQAAGEKAIVKVILETCLLTDEEKVKACLLARSAGAAFVKTSTGFSLKGATEHDVRLMRETVGPDMGVKAAGGIRDCRTAQRMFDAGADRIGASASVAMIEEFTANA